MSGRDYVNNQYIGLREEVKEIFIDGFGSETVTSVSVASKNQDGELYHQVPAGTVLAKHPGDDLYRPCVLDHADGVVSGANLVDVSEARLFTKGDWVELPESVAVGNGRFRQVTLVDEDNEQITLDGSTFSLSDGDALLVDPSRVFDTIQDSGSGRLTTLEVTDASKFYVGQKVSVGSAVKQLVFTPTVQNDADYYLNLTYVSADGETVTTFNIKFISSGGADAQEIVEGLQAALEEQDDDDLIAATEDDSLLTVAAEDENADLFYTVSDNLVDSAVEVSDTTKREVAAVDTGSDTIDLDQEVPYSQGDLIVSEPHSERESSYKIGIKTIDTSTHEYTPQNVLCPTRAYGTVREANLRGLLPRAKTVLEGRIQFSSTSN